MQAWPLVTEAERARLCARLTGDADAAEDLAQETLIEAWRNAHKLTDPAGRERWLAAIARHVCARWRRRAEVTRPPREVAPERPRRDDRPRPAPTTALARRRRTSAN